MHDDSSINEIYVASCRYYFSLVKLTDDDKKTESSKPKMEDFWCNIKIQLQTPDPLSLKGGQHSISLQKKTPTNREKGTRIKKLITNESFCWPLTNYLSYKKSLQTNEENFKICRGLKKDSVTSDLPLSVELASRPSCLSFAGAQSPIKPSVAVYGKVTETPVIEQLYGGVLGESNFVIFDNEGENCGIIALQNCSILYR